MKDFLTIVVSVVGIAAIFAYLIAGGINGHFILPFVGFSAALGVLSLGLFNWLNRRRESDPVYAEVKRRQSEIDSLTVDEAREKALDMLTNRSVFECEIARSGNSETLGNLPPTIQGLFSKYHRIQDADGECRIALLEVGPSQLFHGMTRIGFDIDETELVVRGSNDAVYQVDGSEDPSTLEGAGRFESVYHWILSVDIRYED